MLLATHVGLSLSASMYLRRQRFAMFFNHLFRDLHLVIDFKYKQKNQLSLWWADRTAYVRRPVSEFRPRKKRQ